MHYLDVPDRRPREPDDMIDLHSRDAYEVESADHYRCPHCGLIDTAILHIARDPGGRECVDVECRECHADTLSETRDIATGMACECCGHEYAMAGDDYCYSCAVATELNDCRLIGLTYRARDEFAAFVLDITRWQVWL